MQNILRFALIALVATGLVACNKSGEAPKTEAAAPVVLTPPTDGNDQSWKLYISSVVKQNLQGVRSSPYLYYLPVATVEDFEDQYARQLDNVSGVLARTVQPGNMLAFASPEAKRMADLVVEAFQMADAGSLKGVKVLYIGSPEDGERVRAAVEASTADYIFVELK